MTRKNTALWVLQGLLALLFLFAGGAKLAMDPAELSAQAHMSAGFLQFIAVCELLGGVGLVLPWLTGIRPSLTPLAAALLMVIMVGAVVITLATQPVAGAIMPFVTLLLLGVVAYGRRTQESGMRYQRWASTQA